MSSPSSWPALSASGTGSLVIGVFDPAVERATRKAYVAVDYPTRLAYVEMLPDEKQATTVGFLLRAVASFDTQGISCRRVLSDKGSAYHSKPK